MPFWLSSLLIVVGLVIRGRLRETPLFAEVKKTDQVANAPVREVLRHHWREVLLAAGSRLTENTCFYLFTVYILAYGKEVLHVDSSVLFLAVNAAAAIEVFAIPLFGMLSDRTSRKSAYVAGCLFLIVIAFPYYAMLQTRVPACIILATVIALTGGHALLHSVQAALIPELFPTRLRYTGASLGYQLASPLAGGLAPLVAALLTELFPGEYWPLALYIVAISVVSLACVLRLAETSRKDLRAST